MRIPRFYLGPLALEIDDGAPAPNWQCQVQGRETSARWVEAAPAGPLPREPFDEPALLRRILVEGSTARLGGEPACEPIDGAVFLGKALHGRCLSAGQRKRWVFSRIELARSLRAEDLVGMGVKLEAQLGDSFTRSALFSGEGPLGNIFFSRIDAGEAP